MTTAPADTQAATTQGTAPRPGQALTRTQKILIGIVVTAVVVISGIGFAGSYTAVSALAAVKGFGAFSHAFPIGVDAGIVAFLALDLLLTWLRIPFPLLRHGAWALTAATIAFNAAAAWPDPLGVGMHATIPTLFVIAVEAARHAVGRIADITADRHIENPPLMRWLLAPVGTFRIWRRMRLWDIRSYAIVLGLELEARTYRAQLRKEYGRKWRRRAGADQLLVLHLAKANGMSVADAIDLPYRAAEKQAEAEARREVEARQRAEAEAEAKHQAELRAGLSEAKRRAEVAEAEAVEARSKAEAEAVAEAARLEVEAKRLSEAEAARVLVAETEARLATIAREQQEAEAEAEARRRQRAVEEAQRQAEAARQARSASIREQARQMASEATSGSGRTSGSASGSGVGPASGSASTSGAGRTSGSASGSSPASTSGAGRTSASGPATASASGTRSIAPQRGKRQAEVAEVLARITEAGDPTAITLKWVEEHFDLPQTTAYDRFKTAKKLWEDAQEHAKTG